MVEGFYYAEAIFEEEGRCIDLVYLDENPAAIRMVGQCAKGRRLLRESEERLTGLGNASREILWIRDAETLAWTYLTPAFEDIYGLSREEALLRARDTRAEYVHELRNLHPDGSVHRLSARGRFFCAETGQPVRIIGAMLDTTERREAEERRKLLVAELQHRTRNLITVVRAVSQQTLREAASLNHFRDRFDDRLSALSRVQGLLSHLSAGQRVAFDDLLGSELAALGAPADKVTLEGPADVPLRSATVQTFSLALHELATNALKHGALASADGDLTVRWETNSSVDWRETGVDMTHVGERPHGGGYGRELIGQALPYQLAAKTTYELTSDGVHCVIDVPISAVPN